jgi:hypothetical protein
MGPLIWMLGSRELTEDERRLVLRSMTVIAIPLALITAMALVVGALFFQGQINGQIKQNREAITRADSAIRANKRLARRINNERKGRDAAIAAAVFRECQENELQDNVLVNQVLRPTIQGLERRPNQTPELRAFIANLRQAILAREPPGEKDCKLPGGSK